MPQSIYDRIRHYPWIAKVAAAIGAFLLFWQGCLKVGLFDDKQPFPFFSDCIAYYNNCGTLSEEECRYAANIDKVKKWEIRTCHIVSRK